MNIPDVYFGQIIKEMTVVDDLWKKSVSLEEKLYYFSAVFGTINRVMNFYCDPLLVFVHQILQELHQALTNRLKASKNPAAESFLVVPPEMVDALCGYTQELKAALESELGLDDPAKNVKSRLRNDREWILLVSQRGYKALK
jgi:hypothetical protein